MQKVTKDLFLKLKAIRPVVHSICSYYGIDWKQDRLVNKFWLEYPNKHIEFHTEKELQEYLKQLITETNSDLGFRLPETFKKLMKHDTPSD